MNKCDHLLTLSSLVFACEQTKRAFDTVNEEQVSGRLDDFDAPVLLIIGSLETALAALEQLVVDVRKVELYQPDPDFGDQADKAYEFARDMEASQKRGAA